MRPQGPGNPASPDAERRPDSGSTESNWQQGGEPRGAPSGRPFVERRRQRAAQHAWHEALDAVQRLLARYEETNRFLAEAEETYRGIFENAVIGIFRLGHAGEPVIVNQSMAKLCGYASPEQMLAEVSSLGEDLFVNRGKWREMLRKVQGKDSDCLVEAEINARDGARKWIEFTMRAVRDSGPSVHYEGTAQDISDRKMAEDRLRLLAYYDRVTGLPNRPLFEERLGEALSQAQWKSQRVALLLLELGRFKMINDSLGKAFGDRLLEEVAERIRNTVGEWTTVARVGGAEFTVVLQDVRAAREVEQIAEQLVAAVTGNFSFLENSLNVTCTIGISMFPIDGQDGQTLLDRADVALYSAKEQGTNAIQFFTEEMNNRIRERLRLENGLRLALGRGELFLVYQPQVNIRTGEVSGLEALLRWQHPEKGLVPPAEFIGVAESSGLIVPIGEWVLRTACSQARKWQDAGLRPVPVAVNVSAIQFRQPGFCRLVREVLDETGLDPKYLELELTEGLLLTNIDVMFTLIQELREMGVKLTIDDFGTGYRASAISGSSRSTGSRSTGRSCAKSR